MPGRGRRRFDYCRGDDRATTGQTAPAWRPDRRRGRPARLRRRGPAHHRQRLGRSRRSGMGAAGDGPRLGTGRRPGRARPDAADRRRDQS